MADIEVLVVDDDFDIRETLREVLEDGGVRTEAVGNGAEALAWLRTRGAALPRLILLDWMMPICDGASFRAQQLADPAIANVPVVLLTADAHLDQKATVLSADAYVRKPVQLATLLTLVRRYVP